MFCTCKSTFVCFSLILWLIPPSMMSTFSNSRVPAVICQTYTSCPKLCKCNQNFIISFLIPDHQSPWLPAVINLFIYFEHFYVTVMLVDYEGITDRGFKSCLKTCCSKLGYCFLNIAVWYVCAEMLITELHILTQQYNLLQH